MIVEEKATHIDLLPIDSDLLEHNVEAILLKDKNLVKSKINHDIKDEDLINLLIRFIIRKGPKSSDSYSESKKDLVASEKNDLSSKTTKLMKFNIFLFGDSEQTKLFIEKSKLEEYKTTYLYKKEIKILNDYIELYRFNLINLSDPDISKYMVDYFLYENKPYVVLQITDEKNYFRYVKEIQSKIDTKHVSILMLIIEDKKARIRTNYFINNLDNLFRNLKNFNSLKGIYGPIYLNLKMNELDILDYELDLLFNYLTELCYLRIVARIPRLPIPRLDYTELYQTTSNGNKGSQEYITKIKKLAYNEEDIKIIHEFEESEYLDFEIFKKAKSIGCQSYKDWIQRNIKG